MLFNNCQCIGGGGTTWSHPLAKPWGAEFGLIPAARGNRGDIPSLSRAMVYPMYSQPNVPLLLPKFLPLFCSISSHLSFLVFPSWACLVVHSWILLVSHPSIALHCNLPFKVKRSCDLDFVRCPISCTKGVT